jgi:hypothetical protein
MVDTQGDLFNTDSDGNVIQEVSAATGKISTFADNSTHGGFFGNGGKEKATSAELARPEGVAVDSSGDLFIADTGNNVICEVTSFTVVESAKIELIKVGKHKRGQVIVQQFSAALNLGDAQILGTFDLETVPEGKKGKSQRVALADASYNANTFRVRLRTKKPLEFPPTLELTVKAAQLLDRLGSPLADCRNYLAVCRQS